MNAEDWIRRLGLVPLENEGGYFRETYRSTERIARTALPARYAEEAEEGEGGRSFGTAIYYLLTRDTLSTMHRLRSDEVYYFLAGDPVRMLLLNDDPKTRSGRLVRLSNRGEAGTRPQVSVLRGTWQGSRLEACGDYALMGVTVAPGFEYTDFELGSREKLIGLFPECAQEIRSLT